ncbi:MAG TPA: hypothetical protein VFU15_00045, partial [Bacteroidia bacterium]|nr:hypothetical protein [Bacteroidia bacterium]
MRNFIVLLFSFSSVMLGAQTSMRWEQAYGGGGDDYGYSVKSCPGQGYIVAGSTSSSGISDGWLIRTDSLGLVMWTKTYGGNNVDVLRSVKILPDSGYILAGFSNSAGNGGYDGWALRTDKNGDTLWTKYIGTSDWDFFYDVAPTWDGGFVFAGGTYGRGNGDEDMYFVKLDANGDTVWTKTWGGVKADEARSVIQTGDSLLASCGFTYSLGDSLGDSWILRMTGVGDTVWTRTINVPNFEDKAWGLSDVNLFTRFMVVGETSGTGDADGYFSGFDYNGTLLYIDTTGAIGHDCFSSIVTRPNGTFAALGSSENLGSGSGDFFFFHDRNGWFETEYGTTGIEQGYSIDITHDDGYIMCGYTVGFNLAQPNIFLIKTDTSAATSYVLLVKNPIVSSGMGSVSIYPNPGNTYTSVFLNTSKNISDDLELRLYDVSGKLINTYSKSKWEI